MNTTDIYSYYLNYRNTVDGIVDQDSEDAIEDEMTTPVVPAIPISHVENLKEISQHIMSEFYNVDLAEIEAQQKAKEVEAKLKAEDDEETQSMLPYW